MRTTTLLLAFLISICLVATSDGFQSLNRQQLRGNDDISLETIAEFRQRIPSDDTKKDEIEATLQRAETNLLNAQQFEKSWAAMEQAITQVDDRLKQLQSTKTLDEPADVNSESTTLTDLQQHVDKQSSILANLKKRANNSALEFGQRIPRRQQLRKSIPASQKVIQELQDRITDLDASTSLVDEAQILEWLTQIRDAEAEEKAMHTELSLMDAEDHVELPRLTSEHDRQLYDQANTYLTSLQLDLNRKRQSHAAQTERDTRLSSINSNPACGMRSTNSGQVQHAATACRIGPPLDLYCSRSPSQSRFRRHF